MTSERDTQEAGWTRWVGRFALVAVGFVLFYLLFFDPMHIHPIDGWLQERLGYHAGEIEGGDPEQAVSVWTCPMHSHILQQEPGECPICGMTLVPAGAGGSAAAGGPAQAAEIGEGDGATVSIQPVVVQNMNVQTAQVERRDLEQEIRTVGYLEYDQERMVTVTTKYSGWVEKVYVNYTGEPVRRGQPLFEIYSPELVQTEQEFLSAIEYARRFDADSTEAGRRAEALVQAARDRLRYWDISKEQVAELESTGEIFRTLQVVAPAGGLVMKRMAGLEGMAVKPGMEVYHIAGLSSLWLSVEIFEHQVAQIETGAEAEVEFTYSPGETFTGTVRFIDPEFSEATRTLRVKIEVPNPKGRLRAGMYATVRFHPIVARDALVVPSRALLRTGQRNVVILDLGEGRFAPQVVTLGQEAGHYVEILEGVSEGDRIVTSSQFLIDSESSLQEAVQKMLSQQSGHEGH